MQDKEIHDLLSEAWKNGKCIDWEGGVKRFVPWNEKDRDFDETTERFAEALKYVHAKKVNGEYGSKDDNYKDAYLKLAESITKSPVYDLKIKQFADMIGTAMKNFDENICNLIAVYCNEDALDHYDADKSFDDIGCPNTPIGRLHESVKDLNDAAPSAFDIHLLEGIFGKGQQFGKDVCYGSIRVFSPQEMKIFATRMIDRLIEKNEINDMDLKNVIFGLEELTTDSKKKNENDETPALKKRKLNDLNAENVETGFAYSDEVIYRVAYSLSASAIFDERKKEILEKKVFKLNGKKMPEEYEWNHSLCILAFGLNAAAIGNGIIAHYW